MATENTENTEGGREIPDPGFRYAAPGLRELREHTTNPFFLGVLGGKTEYQNRSTNVAFAMPPLSHIVCRP